MHVGGCFLWSFIMYFRFFSRLGDNWWYNAKCTTSQWRIQQPEGFRDVQSNRTWNRNYFNFMGSSGGILVKRSNDSHPLSESKTQSKNPGSSHHKTNLYLGIPEDFRSIAKKGVGWIFSSWKSHNLFIEIILHENKSRYSVLYSK